MNNSTIFFNLLALLYSIKNEVFIFNSFNSLFLIIFLNQGSAKTWLAVYLSFSEANICFIKSFISFETLLNSFVNENS